MTGKVAGTPLSLAQEAVSDAIGQIYDQTDWSFQRSITYGGWLCPGQIANVGTYTVTPYSNVVVGDQVASAALAARSGQPFITSLQFRNPAYSIYNIVGYAAMFPGSFTLQDLVTGLLYSFSITNAALQFTLTQDASNLIANPVLIDQGSGLHYELAVVSGAFTEILLASTIVAAVTQIGVIDAGTGAPAAFQIVYTALQTTTAVTVAAPAQLTLDRPWMEPTYGPGQPYMIYQAYFVAPVPDFRKFIEVRDTTNAARIDFWSMTQAQLAQIDPQRTEFADPSFVVPAGIDTRPGSSTAGYPMFELWPQQLSFIPYSFSYRCRGVVPQTHSDFVKMSPPSPITEEMVKWRALEVLYQYKEAQKDRSEARGSGANYLMLAQMAAKEYTRLYDHILSIDVNLNGEAFTVIEGRGRGVTDRPYSNQLGQLNIGGYPER